MFGGLSPLRGLLAAGAAGKESSKTIFGDARGAQLAAFLDVAYWPSTSLAVMQQNVWIGWRAGIDRANV
jgi:hypothetical protein